MSNNPSDRQTSHLSVDSDIPLLSIRDLSVMYPTRRGDMNVINALNLDVRRGEVLGLVGESGCGKSTLGKAIMRLIPQPGRITGHLNFDGTDLLTLDESHMRDYRGRRLSMIFQDPMTSLNPIQRLDQHIIEAIRVHEPNVTPEQALVRAKDLAGKLGIAAGRLNNYPHQLSGGMRQRVMIELALALHADLIIADEPTTALDVIVEAQFLDLLRELRAEFGLTIILITHNIGIVAELADRVAVMYAGQIVEIGDVRSVFADPKHPYTQGLLKSIPNLNLEDRALYRMDGLPPNLIAPPTGCRFNPRCPHRMEGLCDVYPPQLLPVPENATQLASCWLHQPHPVGYEPDTKHVIESSRSNNG